VDKVEWTGRALEDLREIYDFIAKDNLPAAERVLDRIDDATARLTQFPYSGRVVPRLKKREVREVVVGKYRVPYEIVGPAVRILRVVHGARLLHAGDLEEDDD
jgi:addiction module RelE/StbE family toxin